MQYTSAIASNIFTLPIQSALLTPWPPPNSPTQCSPSLDFHPPIMAWLVQSAPRACTQVTSKPSFGQSWLCLMSQFTVTTGADESRGTRVHASCSRGSCTSWIPRLPLIVPPENFLPKMPRALAPGDVLPKTRASENAAMRPKTGYTTSTHTSALAHDQCLLGAKIFLCPAHNNI